MPTALCRSTKSAARRETGEEAQAIPFLKRFTVFNSDQCDGLPPEIATTAPPPPPGLIEPQVEYLIKATGIDFRIGGNRAFYMPTEDYVQVPPPQAYFEPINWHRTALHELAHASGHPSRLNRDHVGQLRYQEVCLRGVGCGNLRLRSVAPRSGSCRRCGMPTISALGLKSCARTIVQLSGPLPRPARLRIICSASFPEPVGRHADRRAQNRRREILLAVRRARVRGAGCVSATGWRPRERLPAARRGESK